MPLTQCRAKRKSTASRLPGIQTNLDSLISRQQPNISHMPVENTPQHQAPSSATVAPQSKQKPFDICSYRRNENQRHIRGKPRLESVFQPFTSRFRLYVSDFCFRFKQQIETQNTFSHPAISWSTDRLCAYIFYRTCCERAKALWTSFFVCNKYVNTLGNVGWWYKHSQRACFSCARSAAGNKYRRRRVDALLGKWSEYRIRRKIVSNIGYPWNKMRGEGERGSCLFFGWIHLAHMATSMFSATPNILARFARLNFKSQLIGKTCYWSTC